MRMSSFLLPVLGGLVSSTAASEGPDTSVLYKEIARASNASLMWGPYRPNLYFGVRPRIPLSFMGGLMWTKVDEFADVQHSMFACPLLFDGLKESLREREEWMLIEE